MEKEAKQASNNIIPIVRLLVVILSENFSVCGGGEM
jgi:hypothetical protein